MSAPDQTAQWVDTLWGTRRGWAAIAFGTGQYRDSKGRYQFRYWSDKHYYRWPDERDALLADVAKELATGQVDCYAAPHLRASEKRTKHTALPPMWLHADIDGQVGNPELWNQLDPIRVQSGTAGHLHGYIALTRALDLPTWDRLQRALRDALNGDADTKTADSKISDADVLRLAGTLNFKPAVPPAGVEPSEPTPVTLLPGGGRVWAPEELAERLGVDLNAPNPAPSSQQGDDLGPLAAVPVPAVLPRAVTGALDRHRDNPDRSAVWQAVIDACRRSALDRPQTFAIVKAHVPGGVEKYDGRLETEFDRSWGKATVLWTRYDAAILAGYVPDYFGITCEEADAIRVIYGADSREAEWFIGDVTGAPAVPAPRAASPDMTDNSADAMAARLKAEDQRIRDDHAAKHSEQLPEEPARADQQYYAAPLGCLPPLLREFVQTTAAFVQVPPEMTLFAALASVSFATAGRFLIDVRGHEEPLNLYLMQRALPSERKSGALTAAGTGPLKVAAAKYWEHRKDEQVRIADQIDIANARIKALKAALARPNANDDDRNNLEIERAHLVDLQQRAVHYPVFDVSDATTEGLETLMVTTEGVAASFADEAALLQTINGKYSRDGRASLGSINNAWSRRSIFVQRASVTRHVPEPHLVLCQLIQPEPFAALMGQLSTGADGFLSRWLYSEPAPHGARKSRGGTLERGVVSKWQKTVHALLERCWGKRGTEGLALAGEAWVKYDDVFDAIEVERAAECGTNGPYAEWLGKAANGHILRIAALFELIEDTNATDISGLSLERAITLYGWLRLEARKALSIASGDELAPEVEREALKWIAGHRKRGETYLTARDLMRGPRKFRGMKREEVEAILTQLEYAGWLVLCAEPPMGLDSMKPRTDALTWWAIRRDFDEKWQS